MSGTARQQGFSSPPYIGIGIVTIPYKQDREKYIKQCYRSRRVNLLLETGMVVANCNVVESAMQDIKFPKDYKSVGSQVVYATERINQVPYVVGVLDKIHDRISLNENEFNFSKDIGRSRVNLRGNARGEIYLDVESEDGGLIKINASGEGSKVELNSEGVVEINGSEQIELNTTTDVRINYLNDKAIKVVSLNLNEEGFKYKDEDDNVFEIDKKKGIINHFNGSEPLTKGNTLKTQLEQNNTYLTQLQTAISAALTTLESLGLGSLSTFTSSMTGAQKGNYSNINSEKVFID